MIEESVIIAGAGGQGNLFLGEILCLAAIKEGYNATWIPSYGPQMRGGKSTCTVVISDEEIGSPFAQHPNTLIVMNKSSLDFLEDLKNGSCAIINQSLAEYNGARKDIDTILVETTPILDELKNPRVLNVILLGVYLKKKRNILKLESVFKALEYKFKESGREKLFDLNKQAILKGYNLV